MKTESAIDLEKVLLEICAGEEVEAKEAFTWLYRNCWEEVFGVLKSRADLCGLDINQKEDVVLTAFSEFWEQARGGKIQDTDRDPRALLHTIAHRRGIDFLRRKTAKKRLPTEEEFEELKQEALEASSFGAQWRLLEIRQLADDVMNDFYRWMREQKGVCRRTAFAMALFFPDLATPKDLHQALSKEMDCPPTYESVKKARADVLSKFMAVIDNKYKTR